MSTHDVLLLLFCLPVVVAMTTAKMLIAMYLADNISFLRGDECVVYSIYKDGKLKFSTTIDKEADSFYKFLVERYGRLAVRLETIKV